MYDFRMNFIITHVFHKFAHFERPDAPLMGVHL